MIRPLPRIAAAALAAAALAAPSFTHAQRLDGIAAVVNNEVILQSDLEEQLGLFLSRTGLRPDSSQADTLRRSILDQLIEEKLIVGEAERQKITVSDAEVNRQVDEAIGDAKERLGSEEAFQRQLQAENLSEEKLRERYRGDMRRQLLAQRLVQKQIPQKPVPSAEAEAYFKAHKDKFPKAPPEAQLSVILVPVEADSAAMEAGRRKAAQVLQRLRGGEKFAKVAQEVSEDPSSARAGGDLGFFTRGRMVASFEDVAFTLPLNKLSEPVRTPFGWHLIEVLERDTLRSHVAGKTARDSLDAHGKPVLEVHARHILVRVAPGDSDTERTERLAERVRAEAAKGTDFATLARRYSKLEGASADGDVGWRSYAELNENVRAAVDTCEIGSITPVIRGPSGYSIFRVRDKHPEREYGLEEIRARLPEAAAQIQARERYEEWVKGLRAKAHIEIRKT